MNLSREYLQRCSDQSGYQVGPLEKVARLGEFASNVGRHSLLSNALALKGGTALNLCFGPPRRLSVDLDFNYIAHLDRERMLEERPKVEEAVSALAIRMGYRVQRSADAFAGRKLYLQYASVLGIPDRIEVDVNYLFRLPLAGTEPRQLWQPGDLDRPEVRLVSLEEILIGKFLAFFDRCAPRDLWDLANLPESALPVVASGSFRTHLLALSAILPHPISTYGPEGLNRAVTERTIAEQLVPMLIAGTIPKLENLVSVAWNLASRFVALETNETAYFTAVSHGDLTLDVLFPDAPGEAERLAQHPALLWKIANVREHLKRGS